MAGWKRWVLLIGGGLIAAVLTGAGLLAWLVSRVDVRAEIERAVENATGRDVVIAGNVGVIYWPVLGVRAGDVTIANVEGGHAPAFIAAEDIDVGVELRPLLDRQIHVRRLVLQRPQISLEIDAQGQPNWVLTPRAQPGPTPPGQPSVDVGRTELRGIRINDGEVSYRDARGDGQGWAIGDVDLRTALTSLNEPMRARGSLRYNDQNVEIDMQIGQPGAAMRGQVTPISIDIDSELIDAEFDGQTIAASGELAGTMRANGPSLRRLAGWVGSPIQGGVGLEQFAVTGRLGVGNGAYEFSNAGFALDLVRGRGDFVLTEVRGKPYLSGRLELFDF
ncbi:MAG TPA: AsmA family protein, partial [Vitreimonas sp.]|nr:AsmA family protein [Vitreimonas sp.]